MEWIIAIALCVVNLVAFAIYGIDKSKAKKNKWRISEAKLIGIALVGGSIGALAGMKVFRHKTKHTKFTVGVPVILLLHIAIAVAVIWLMN